MDWLESTGRAQYTNVIALSDHGHYTIKEPPQDLIDQGTAGVDAISMASLLEQELGLMSPEVILGENAGGVLIYLEDPAEIPRVSTWLMGKEYVGPVLCTEARGVALPEGTLGLSCLGMEGPRAPDVAFSMAWDGSLNPWGHPGFNYAAGKVNKAGGLAGLGTRESVN